MSVGRLLDVTREVDPEGRYLAAAAVDNGGDDMARRVLVDTTRLATVVAWDDAWADVSPSTLQRELRPPQDRITFSGDEVSVTASAVSLESSTGDTAVLWVQYVDEDGEQRNAVLGELRNGASPRTVTGAVRGCDDGCTLEQLFVSGPSMSVLDVDGSVTLGDVTVDGQPVDWRLGDAGRVAGGPAVPGVAGGPAGHAVARRVTGCVWTSTSASCRPGSTRSPPWSPASPGSRRRRRPTWCRWWRPTARRRHRRARPAPGWRSTTTARWCAGSGSTAATSRCASWRGCTRCPVSATRGRSPTSRPRWWSSSRRTAPRCCRSCGSRRGRRPRCWTQVEAAGAPLTPLGDLDETLTGLRNDAFSLGLRLFLMVGLATLLLAVFGVFASAVLQARWRAYEVASLRVVGVSQRTLLRASVLEYVVMLGLAVLLGVAAAYVALLLVLPSLSLGTAAEHEPAPLYAAHGMVLAGVGLALFVVATLIALLVSRRITRLGRPSTLRWAEQG